MSIVCVHIYIRDNTSPNFFLLLLLLPFLFFSCTLTYFMCIRLLVRQLKQICTRPSTVEAVREYYFFSCLDTYAVSCSLVSAIIFFFSSLLIFFLIQCYYSVYTFKVFSLYGYTTSCHILSSCC
jgi:hypothetical protein